MLYENYYKLLYAIFHTEQNGKTNFICVYDIKDSDRLVAIFNSSKSCSQFMNTTPKVIDSTISKGILRNRRYKLERVRLDK